MRRNACSRWSCNGATAPGGSRKYSGRKRSRRTGRCGCSVSTAPPRPKSPFLSQEMNRALAAYAAGVNAFLGSHRGALPPEFLLLGFTPEDLEAGRQPRLGQADGNSAGGQLPRRIAARPDGPDHFRSRSCHSLSGISRTMPRRRWRRCSRSTGSWLWTSSTRALPAVVGPNYASNNWVVDGAHSASGKPLLANDPHLGFASPGFWYLARLKTPRARNRRRHRGRARRSS